MKLTKEDIKKYGTVREQKYFEKDNLEELNSKEDVYEYLNEVSDTLFNVDDEIFSKKELAALNTLNDQLQHAILVLKVYVDETRPTMDINNKF